MPGTLSSDIAAGYRGKVSLRGTKGNDSRAVRASETENVNPNGVFGAKRSPRLGPSVGITNGRPFSARRREAGTAFGADITNIASGGSLQTEKNLQPLKQLPQSEVPVTGTERQQLTKREAVLDTTRDQEMEEYAADISDQLFVKELAFKATPDYMDMQTHLTPKMRAILIDWLIEVHMKYKLRTETLHLTINLVDRYLSKALVKRNNLQLIGVVAMLVASKFEEIHPPELHDCVYITDRAYTKQDVLRMECTMLSALGFQITVPTVAHFFPGLQKANGCNSVHSKLAQYILELGLLEVKVLQYSPSQVVSAALLLSNELLGHSPRWPQSMIQSSRYSEESLLACVELLRSLFETDRALVPGGQLQAVHKKFSLKEHHAVAIMRL